MITQTVSGIWKTNVPVLVKCLYSDVLRDLKKFTSKEIITTIENNKQESRKNWMLWIFKKAGKRTAGIRNINSGNRIIKLFNPRLDKLNYMHNHPVKARIVEKAEEYLLSSARD
jgi:hypothetical protein